MLKTVAVVLGPDMLSTVFVPALTMVVMVPLTYCVCGPIDSMLGDLIGNFLFGLGATGVIFAALIMGVVAGGFASALYAGITHVSIYILDAANFTMLFNYIPGGTANIINGAISCVITLVVSTLVTYFFGFTAATVGLITNVAGLFFAPMAEEFGCCRARPASRLPSQTCACGRRLGHALITRILSSLPVLDRVVLEAGQGEPHVAALLPDYDALAYEPAPIRVELVRLHT